MNRCSDCSGKHDSKVGQAIPRLDEQLWCQFRDLHNQCSKVIKQLSRGRELQWRWKEHSESCKDATVWRNLILKPAASENYWLRELFLVSWKNPSSTVQTGSKKTSSYSFVIFTAFYFSLQEYPHYKDVKNTAIPLLNSLLTLASKPGNKNK